MVPLEPLCSCIEIILHHYAYMINAYKYISFGCSMNTLPSRTIDLAELFVVN